MHSVFIRLVTHLTDARYFAAMGVEWMSLELNEDPLTFARWHSLRDWVEGVSLAAELSTDDESVLAKSIIDVKPEGIVARDLRHLHLTGGLRFFLLGDTPVPSDQREFITPILMHDPERKSFERLQVSQTQQIFLEANWTPALIQSVLDEGYRGGFCFRTTLEERTGVKDFSRWDEMLEMLNV
jgi:hypothetical protein